MKLNKEQLKDKIAKLTQFPHKQRKENYQSYYIGDEKISGARDTSVRMDIMKIPKDLTNKSILDLGCNLGEIANECCRRGATRILGLDNQEDYIECAIDLAEYNGYEIEYACKDLTKIDDSVLFINKFFDCNKIDYVFALSLYKHIKSKMFEILDGINYLTCIIESNNAPQGLQTGHVQEMITHIEKRGWKWRYIATDKTRSPRIILEVSKGEGYRY